MTNHQHDCEPTAKQAIALTSPRRPSLTSGTRRTNSTAAASRRQRSRASETLCLIDLSGRYPKSAEGCCRGRAWQSPTPCRPGPGPEIPGHVRDPEHRPCHGRGHDPHLCWAARQGAPTEGWLWPASAQGRGRPQGSQLDQDRARRRLHFHRRRGPVMKRFRPRSMGRANRIRKRTSHLTIVVATKHQRAASGA